MNATANADANANLKVGANANEDADADADAQNKAVPEDIGANVNAVEYQDNISYLSTN